MCITYIYIIPYDFFLDICNQQLVSGVNPVPDSAFSASSAYHKGSTTKDYNVARARINTTETKDSKGVLHLGAWSAQNLNVDQWIQVRSPILHNMFMVWNKLLS